MNFCKIAISGLTIIWVSALSGFAMAQPLGPPPAPPATSPGTPGDATQQPQQSGEFGVRPIPPPDNMAGPPPRPQPGEPGYRPPPPPSDTREEFSYSPSREYEDVTVVVPADGSDPLYVSKNYSDIVLQSDQSDASLLQKFRNYENMTESVSDKFMNQFFPDASAPDANMAPGAVQGNELDAIIEQDPQAGPYARVTLTDKEGNVVSQNSISAKAATDILNHPHMTPEQKIANLTKGDFTLPESARQNFANMSAEELQDMVFSKPELQRQEFAKMGKVFAEVKAQRAAGRSGEGGGEQSTATRTTGSAGNPGAPSAGNVPGFEASADDEEYPDEFARDEPVEPPLVAFGLLAAIALGALGAFLFWLNRNKG